MLINQVVSLFGFWVELCSFTHTSSSTYSTQSERVFDVLHLGTYSLKLW